MKPAEPLPVKLIIGYLYCDRKLIREAMEYCRNFWGSEDYQSREYFFDNTDYYQQEMGKPLFRKFVAFNKLIDASKLAEIKLASNEIEDRLSEANKRRVNLDPGYLDYDKLILASAKYNYQKIYLQKGIYADPTLFYRKGRYYAPEWSFPDFKDGMYEEDFLHIRFIYKKQLQELAVKDDRK